MRIKGDLNAELTKVELQSLYMAAKLELERYKEIALGDLTEQIRALYFGKEKIWNWINFSDSDEKPFINRMEWESLLFAAQIELHRYKGFEWSHLRADLHNLDYAAMNIDLWLKTTKKETV